MIRICRSISAQFASGMCPAKCTMCPAKHTMCQHQRRRCTGYIQLLSWCILPYSKSIWLTLATPFSTWEHPQLHPGSSPTQFWHAIVPTMAHLDSAWLNNSGPLARIELALAHLWLGLCNLVRFPVSAHDGRQRGVITAIDTCKPARYLLTLPDGMGMWSPRSDILLMVSSAAYFSSPSSCRWRLPCPDATLLACWVCQLSSVYQSSCTQCLHGKPKLDVMALMV